MAVDLDLRAALDGALSQASTQVVGRLESVQAGRMTARLPGIAVGDVVSVERSGRPLLAEVVGFEADAAILLPFSSVVGVRPGASVVPTPHAALAPDADAALGEVIDALGVSLMSERVVAASTFSLVAPPPHPLRRAPIARRLLTGIRVIDAFTPLGEGQRVGVFAGSGVGKSTLLAQLVRQTAADVCIVGLVGERGREVGDFVREALDDESRARTTIVVATSDAPPAFRIRAAEMATALAEQWRARGKSVLLVVDSLTRYARALREAALMAGEPMGRGGYPPSVFARLPGLLERAGCAESGAITAIYTVLVEGGDLEEPVSDEVRGIVDGHIVLDRVLAERAHFPAVNVLRSVSRVARQVAPDVAENADIVRRALSLLDRRRDAIDLGVYTYGTTPAIDAVIDAEADIDAFVRQDPHENTPARRVDRGLADLADALRDVR
jgi:type III secretion protein N (ATPase)